MEIDIKQLTTNLCNAYKSIENSKVPISNEIELALSEYDFLLSELSRANIQHLNIFANKRYGRSSKIKRITELYKAIKEKKIKHHSF